MRNRRGVYDEDDLNYFNDSPQFVPRSQLQAYIRNRRNGFLLGIGLIRDELRHGLSRRTGRAERARVLNIARLARTAYGERRRARNLLRGAQPVDSVVRRRPMD